LEQVIGSISSVVRTLLLQTIAAEPLSLSQWKV